jgi:hypothetical protein
MYIHTNVILIIYNSVYQGKQIYGYLNNIKKNIILNNVYLNYIFYGLFKLFLIYKIN